MIELAFILLGGLMCRADGWGAEAYPDNKLVELLTDFFGQWTTGLMVGLGAFAMADWQVGLMVWVGWVLWRAPHLGGYWVAGNEHKMFLRGALTIAPLVAALIYYTDASWWLMLTALGMGVAQVISYNGVRRVTDWKHLHIISEWMSGMAFASVVLFVI